MDEQLCSGRYAAVGVVVIIVTSDGTRDMSSVASSVRGVQVTTMPCVRDDFPVLLVDSRWVGRLHHAVGDLDERWRAMDWIGEIARSVR